jgi:hypothetical protein
LVLCSCAVVTFACEDMPNGRIRTQIPYCGVLIFDMHDLLTSAVNAAYFASSRSSGAW